MFVKRTFLLAPSAEVKRERKAHRKARNYLLRLRRDSNRENRSCLSCFARARNRCVLFVVSPQGSLRHYRGRWGLRRKARFTSDSLQRSALLSNDNVHNSSVPESFTIAWSTRMRNTGYTAGEAVRRGRTGEMQEGPGVRRHGELFIKPSSRRISDRTRSHVTYTCCKYKVMPSRLPMPSKISYAHGEKFMMIVLSCWMER